jgi:photosystem II stability/assembly factor-like uncharacterized protein
MEPEEELEWRANPARGRRALAVIVASALTIGVASFVYVRPSLTFADQAKPQPFTLQAAAEQYQLAAVDFVSPSVGWVVAELGAGKFTILQTADAGSHWRRQLSGINGGAGLYLRFFDASNGVFVLTGSQPVLYQTGDGGRTWTSQEAMPGRSPNLLSASFADPSHGWLLVRTGGPPFVDGELFRTTDAGATWMDLGSPVVASDQPYRVEFTDRERGWLDSRSAGPYLYTTADAGATWNRVPLPAPAKGWARQGEFFVTAQPTRGPGVVASVVNFPPLSGRSASGAAILSYPPLRVRAFDGGSSVTYTYFTVKDLTSAPGSSLVATNQVPGLPEVQPADQVVLSSVDGGNSWSIISPPLAAGAIGYFDASNWWWIGSGSWSRSSDGGKTWTRNRNIGVPEPLRGSLQVLDATHAWFGAMAGTRPLVETTDDGGITWRMILLPPIAP